MAHYYVSVLVSVCGASRLVPSVSIGWTTSEASLLLQAMMNPDVGMSRQPYRRVISRLCGPTSTAASPESASGAGVLFAVIVALQPPPKPLKNGCKIPARTQYTLSLMSPSSCKLVEIVTSTCFCYSKAQKVGSPHLRSPTMTADQKTALFKTLQPK